MRFAVGVGSKIWMIETAVTKVLLKNKSEALEAGEDEEEFKEAPVDPHSVGGLHAEISPHAIMDGATDPRRFGFYGSKGQAGGKVPEEDNGVGKG